MSLQAQSTGNRTRVTNGHLPMGVRSLLAAACLAACALVPLAADAQISADGVKSSENRQAQIRQETQRASAELDVIIAEFDHNGLGDGADVQILRAIRGVLGNLSEKDMQRVIGLLRTARLDADPSAVRKNVTDAFSGQKGIVVQMRQLLAEYQKQQELIDLSLRFSQLADRQNANLKAAKRLFWHTRDVGGGAKLGDIHKSLLQLQTSEQDALRDEGRLQLDRLAKLNVAADPASAERIGHVVAAAKESKLGDYLNRSADELRDARLMSAAGLEKSARDEFRELSRLVAPAKEPLQLLRAAAEDLVSAMSQQRFITTQIKGLPKEVDVAASEIAATLEDTQADVVDIAELLRKDLDEIAPEAVLQLKTAQNEMQGAREDIRTLHADPAGKHSDGALAGLTAAHAKVLEAIARLEAAALNNDLIAQAKDLRAQLALLREKEETLKKQTAGKTDAAALSPLSTQQGQLKKVAQELQLLAAAEAPAAVKPLIEAGKEMDSAEIALGTRSNATDATRSEQAAIEQLQKAQDALDEKIAQLEDAKNKLEKLEKARDEVAKMMVKEQKIELATAKAAALTDNPKAKPATPPESPKDLAKAQGDLAKTADATAKDLPPEAKDAVKPLDDAAKDMKAAESALNKPDPKAATPPADSAMANLAKAKAALDDKIAEAQKDLGQNPDNAAKLDDLAKAMDKAQDDLSKAMGDPPKDAVKDLAKKEEQIAKDLDQMAQAGQPVAEAQKDAAKAADALAKNDLPKAAAEMQKASDAMAEAQKADAAKPEAGAPEAAKPEAGAPEAAKPEAGAPDAGKPDAGKPDAGKAGAGKPDAGKPDAGKPDAGKPDAGKADAGKPEAGKPGAGKPGAGKPAPGAPSLAQAAQQQADLQKELAQMTAQQPAPKADDLAKVASDVAAAAAQDTAPVPADSAAAMAQAESALAQAAAAAQAGQPQAAQAAAAQAAAALASAQASLAPGQPGQPGKPGQGPPMPGMADENNAKQGMGERKDNQANATGQTGALSNSRTGSSYLGLPPRDRQAIQQSRNERYPEEYGPMIEQYLKNLSDKPASK